MKQVLAQARLHFRPASTADIHFIMQLEQAGFDAAFHESAQVYEERLSTFATGSLIASVQTGDGYTDIGCFFSELWEPCSTWSAETFALGHPIAERHRPDGTELYISSLTIAPAWRQHGLGRALFAGALAHIAKQLPHIRSELLLVNANWHAARHIYTQQSFQTVAELPAFFRDSQGDAHAGIVMRRLRPTLHSA